MKKALSLVVILTLLCFPVSGFCSVTDGVVGAIEGAVAAPIAAIAIGTAVGGVVSLFATPMAGVAAFKVTLDLISAHIWTISILGGVSGAIEGARKGYPLTAGVYGGAGLGVALGAFR
ncbi:hypothetical protein [Candidatus Endomicrobiellum devescovinae]|jgi:hypothetical protein|uniref:hypothetical protein n=1 Tax=Candidatus Endomicrobiellum devescovinae TaxID=3242322 RepID=UPI0028273016|nr:hypothetical protein [Endomicrobium sp.]